MIQRHLAAAVREATADTPVLMLNGARQTGKSTLARAQPGFRYLTLDDTAVLSAAKSSPADFIAGLTTPTVIDEVQHAPDLFPALKAAVDRDRKPGRFLLTGSADIFLLPSISESLAGRIEILTLWPFSRGELQGSREGFVDALFASGALPPFDSKVEGRDDLFRLAVIGGYPEAVERTDRRRRRAWFNSYITTILQRDVRAMSNIDGLTDLPRLLRLLAARATTLMNYAEISRSSGLPQSTLKRYLTLLETTFLLQRLPAWSGNLSKRLTRSPKILLVDTGLMAHLLGLQEGVVPDDGLTLGRLMENFVAMELLKQIGWSDAQPGMYHFRTTGGQEVDLVLEDAAGRVVAIEVKASATVGGRDFRHLRALEKLLGTRFRRGVVLYTGGEALAFGPRLHALPMDALWRLNAKAI